VSVDPVAAFEPHRVDPWPGLPDVEWVLAPTTLDGAAEILAAATQAGRRVLLWGGGTHQGFGHPVDADVVLSTRYLTRIVDWQADDLTVVVEAGVTVEQLEDVLAEREQTAVLPERPGPATVGGTIAAGHSGWRRLRYGPTRDRMLESVVVTGDGRVVTAGGRVVKNVSGYDIPRLVTGSFGALGLIGMVCLKLWPRPAAAATVTVDDAARASQVAYRPLAVLETEAHPFVHLAGTEAEVTAQAKALGGETRRGLHWPKRIESATRLVVRVPPSRLGEAVVRSRRLDPERMVATHGVGEIELGFTSVDPEPVTEFRDWCEAAGGSLVVAAGLTGVDPWGTLPSTVALQRRVKTAFDPVGVVNPGRLPGGV
jgi:glycolate oxidase FAD binding subunit